MKIYKNTIVIASQKEIEEKSEKIEELIQSKSTIAYVKKKNENKVEITFNKNIDNINSIQRVSRYFSSLFTVMHDGAKYNKNSRWDGRKSFYRINKKSDVMEIGFLNQFVLEIKKFLDGELNVNIGKYITDILWIIDSNTYEEVSTMYKKDVVEKWINSHTFKFTPHEHQKETLIESLKHQKKLIRVPTSGGKSFCYYLYYKFLLEKKDKNLNFLLIVPNIQLVDQMEKEFVFREPNLKENIMCISSKHNNIFGMGMGEFLKPKKVKFNLFISTFQSLNTNNTNPAANNIKDFLKDIDVIMVDEVHRSKVKTIQNVLKYADNAQLRFGQTGTYPESKWDIYHIFSLFRFNYSNIITTNELIDKGISSDFELNWRILDIYKEIPKYEKKSYQEEVAYINEHKLRETKVNEIINEELNKNKNVLVFFHNRIVGKKHFLNFFNERNKKKTFYIDGNTEPDLRKNIKSKIESEYGNLLFASFYTTGTGIDFKNVHTFIYIQNFKSNIIVFQTLGRGLRVHESKEKLKIVSIIDKFPYNNYMWKHYKKRLSLMRKEFGKEKIKLWQEKNIRVVEL